MASMYRWVVLLAFFFPMGSLAAFIVDDFKKPALTCRPFLLQWQGDSAMDIESSSGQRFSKPREFGDIGGHFIQLEFRSCGGHISSNSATRFHKSDCHLQDIDYLTRVHRLRVEYRRGSADIHNSGNRCDYFNNAHNSPGANDVYPCTDDIQRDANNQLGTNDQLDVNILHHLIVNARCIGSVFVFGNRKPVQ